MRLNFVELSPLIIARAFILAFGLIYLVNAVIMLPYFSNGFFVLLADTPTSERRSALRAGHEVQCVISQLDGHPREVLITSHVQVINAECIEALATVLTPRDYEKYIPFVPENMFPSVYMCFREFRNNKVMPFSLSELDGYYNQTIFTMLGSQQASQLKSKGHKLHEVKDITREDPSRQGPRGSRSVGEYPKLESGHSGIRKSIPGNQIAKAEPTCLKLKIKFPSRGPVGIQFVEPQCKLSFEVGDNLEVLCQDSGMRGCWFLCKVLQVSQKRLKVQYDDIQDCDSPEKLEVP
ncbi:hypothetical protein HAX54_013088 [Datura stramonium]|uniref:Agenet-like domain-containing protein n=1 Tax=Datura stramonium TaxID=4076 RepID=A0ABS8RXZ4_DATST|nr:hypothetical protein [Datura stramonium]